MCFVVGWFSVVCWGVGSGVGLGVRWLGVRWFGVGLGGEHRSVVRSFRLCKLLFVFRIFVLSAPTAKFF